MARRKNSSKSQASDSPSLGGRPFDVLFIFFFGLFAVIAVTIDVVQSTGGYLEGNELRTVDNWREEFKDHKLLPAAALQVNFFFLLKFSHSGLKTLSFFFVVVAKYFYWWSETVDPLLLQNPVWYKAMGLVSPFFYVPFYIFAIYAFIKGNLALSPILKRFFFCCAHEKQVD